MTKKTGRSQSDAGPRTTGAEERDQNAAAESVTSLNAAARATAAEEIAVAVAYLSRALAVTAGRVEPSRFCTSLADALYRRFHAGLWFPGAPLRGSAARAIRVESGRLDPVLIAASAAAGLAPAAIAAALPSSFTLWIDPGDVSVRVGGCPAVALLRATSPAQLARCQTLPGSGAPAEQLSPAARAFAPSPPPVKRELSIDAPALSIDAPAWESPVTTPAASPAASPGLPPRGMPLAPAMSFSELPRRHLPPPSLGSGWLSLPPGFGYERGPISAPPVMPLGPGAAGWGQRYF